MSKNDVLEKVALKWIKDALITKASEVPDTVYHYTDAAGLFGMLKSGRIWATDFRFLNDRTELLHLAGHAHAIIDSKISDPKDDHDLPLCKAISKYLRMDNPNNFYVFSMSSEDDDLSQWRGYAREGKGFTIGISGEAINSLSESTDRNFFFSKVEYDHDKQTSLIERALDDMKRQVAKQADLPDADTFALYEEAGRYMDGVISGRSTVSKHKSFSSEREWRLVAYRPKAADQALVRVSGQRLVPYIEIDLTAGGSVALPVVSIGIGPGFTGSEDIHAVKALCRQLEIDPKIYFADTPYRRV